MYTSVKSFSMNYKRVSERWITSTRGNEHLYEQGLSERKKKKRWKWERMFVEKKEICRKNFCSWRAFLTLTKNRDLQRQPAQFSRFVDNFYLTSYIFEMTVDFMKSFKFVKIFLWELSAFYLCLFFAQYYISSPFPLSFSQKSACPLYGHFPYAVAFCVSCSLLLSFFLRQFLTFYSSV